MKREDRSHRHIFMSISHSPKLPKLTNIIFHLSVTIKTGLGKRFVVFNILRVLIASSDSLSSISDGHNDGQMVTCLRCGMVNSCHVSQCDNHKSFKKSHGNVNYVLSYAIVHV